MPAYGSDFAERARALVQDFRDQLAEATDGLQSPDPAVRAISAWKKKEAENGLIILDDLAKKTYKLSQDLGQVPQGMGYVKEKALSIAAPVYDANFSALEGRVQALKDAGMKNNMGAGTPPDPATFYPAGETFDWYNPMDWIRQGEYNVAAGAYQVGAAASGAASTATDAAVVTVLKVGLAALLLKKVWDTTKTKKRG